MDRRPIGVFDSGLGGLTAVREFQRILPGEDLIYFGDTGRVPYGSRSKETIIRYARQDVAFLRTFDLKAVVIGCGTVSTTALDVLCRENDVPVWGVVEPAAQAAVNATENKKVGLIGTQATIRSGAYEAQIAQLDGEVDVLSRPCPLFVPLVENGRFQPGDPVAQLVVEEYMAPFQAAGVDTLILGCTHYPLLIQIIGQVMGPQVKLINVGQRCAELVAGALAQRDALTAPDQVGTSRYYVSDGVEDFGRLASLFLQRDVSESVTQIDISTY